MKLIDADKLKDCIKKNTGVVEGKHCEPMQLEVKRVA